MEFYHVLIYILAYIGFFAIAYYVISLFTYYKNKEIDGESTDKKVSILIPAYNEEEGIARTIESALSLDYPRDKLEIIVVDDGSHDDTYKIAKTFISSKNSIVKVFTKKNNGKASALNFGIEKSKGEIIVSMDADSFVNPDALKKMVYFFKNKEVMSVSPSMGVYKPKNILERIQHIEYYMGVFLRKSFATVNAIHITPGAFSAYRKEFFLKHGGYDEKNITEDLEVALRIQRYGYIIENAPKAVAYTIVPKTFRPLMIQRRRWYVGLINNLWEYKDLISPKKGPLGLVVLPVAIITVILSLILTVYSIIRSLIQVRNELISLSAINFRFNDAFEINQFVFSQFFYQLFSSPIFLISFIFAIIMAFYLRFSRHQMRYSENIRLNLFLFLFFYSFLFSFWWIISFLYAILNKKVIWRKE
ncbi:glycosyltransferase family 2 protein [Candidatus Pacearchaeota archaeon]|nr:glycosyltransferase family 2 protein [Candidatus Pacearchaeota archaeon]